MWDKSIFFFKICIHKKRKKKYLEKWMVNWLHQESLVHEFDKNEKEHSVIQEKSHSEIVVKHS